MALGLDLQVMLLLNPFGRCVHVLAWDLRPPDAETELEALADAAPDRYAPAAASVHACDHGVVPPESGWDPSGGVLG
jgi:hypothetical protein